VDFVREQVTDVLPPSLRRFHLTDDKLVAWSNREGGHATAYDLRAAQERLEARPLSDMATVVATPLDARQVFFSRLPLTWARWCECWQNDQNGDGHPLVFGEGMRLWPSAAAATSCSGEESRSQSRREGSGLA